MKKGKHIHDNNNGSEEINNFACRRIFGKRKKI